jgi:alanine-glyoxylate transaminase/serine-glyoxylate transaminase/serine-pyruvate transaminase
VKETPYSEFFPPTRLLLGPGPANIHPRIFQAICAPVIGYADPALFPVMDEVQEMLRSVFETKNAVTLPVSGTGSAGMETCLVNILEPGDSLIVGIKGYFGDRIKQVAERLGAKVIEIRGEAGSILDPQRFIEALHQHPEAKAVAVVHAETSTGIQQPLEEIGIAVAKTDTLFLVDCVTSLGGLPIRVDHNHIDVAFSCSQKCIGMISGLSPVTFSAKALETLKRRKTLVSSFYLSIDLLSDYWGEKRTYHHTLSTTYIYGLREALRIIMEEGLEQRFKRHQEAGDLVKLKLQKLGCKLFAQEGYRLPMLTSVVPPQHVDVLSVRNDLLKKHNIEIGLGFGDLKSKIWRVGLMGYNARRGCVEQLCGILEDYL